MVFTIIFLCVNWFIWKNTFLKSSRRVKLKVFTTSLPLTSLFLLLHKMILILELILSLLLYFLIHCCTSTLLFYLYAVPLFRNRNSCNIYLVFIRGYVQDNIHKHNYFKYVEKMVKLLFVEWIAFGTHLYKFFHAFPLVLDTFWKMNMIGILSKFVSLLMQ